MPLTPEAHARIVAAQEQLNRDQMALLAQELRLRVRPPVVPRETTRPEPIDPPPAAESRLVCWTDFAGREPPPRTWLLRDWLTTGATLLAGKGGTGKSLLAQTLATALATGQHYLAPVEEAGTQLPVLHWACEDDLDELWRRQARINTYFSVDWPALAHYHLEPRVGLDSTLFASLYGTGTPTALLGRLREQVNDLRAILLILDNAGQIFGANENSRHDVTAFVNLIGGLVTDRPFAVLLLAHPAKASGSEYSGSTAWEASVRTRWYLGHSLPDQDEPAGREDGTEPDPNTRFLCKRKANYSGADYVQLDYFDGVLRPTRTPTNDPAAARDLGSQLEAARQSVVHAVNVANASGIRVTRARNTAASLISFMRRANFGVGLTDRVLEQAIVQVLIEKRIVEGMVGKGADRHKLKGLLPAGVEP
jgi:hypothetical protein